MYSIWYVKNQLLVKANYITSNAMHPAPILASLAMAGCYFLHSAHFVQKVILKFHLARFRTLRLLITVS